MKPRSLLFLLVPIGLASVAGAAETIPVQGMLTDAQGTPLTASVEITFSLYDTDTGGDFLWQETLPVTVDNGLFSVYLGQSVTLDLELFKNNQELWLGIQVAEDQEMNRVYLGNVPFAAYARHTDAEPAPSIPSGFCMFSFNQSACPAGWTKNTAYADRLLMLGIDNPGETGGFDSHTHDLGSINIPDHAHTTANHTLNLQQIPSHNHEFTGTSTDHWNGLHPDGSSGLVQANWQNTNSAGGGQPHNHGDTGPAGAATLSGSTGSDSTLPPHVQVVVCCKS